MNESPLKKVLNEVVDSCIDALVWNIKKEFLQAMRGEPLITGTDDPAFLAGEAVLIKEMKENFSKTLHATTKNGNFTAYNQWKDSIIEKALIAAIEVGKELRKSLREQFIPIISQLIREDRGEEAVFVIEEMDFKEMMFSAEKGSYGSFEVSYICPGDGGGTISCAVGKMKDLPPDIQKEVCAALREGHTLQ